MSRATVGALVGLLLGAGFGALSGAVIGLAGAITVALRRRDSVSGAPSSPEPPRKA